jgi:hypothetical protein
MPATFCIDFPRDNHYFSCGVVVVIGPGVEQTVLEVCVMVVVIEEVVVLDDVVL